MTKRVKKLQKYLHEQRLDGILVRTHEGDNQNVRYLSGFGGSSATLIISRKSSLIVSDPRYFIRAVEEARGFQLVKMMRGTKYADVLNKALLRAGLKEKSRVGFESGLVSVALAKSWQAALKIKLTPTVHIVERFRQYKDANELRSLRVACRITSRVYSEVAALLQAGMTEADVAFELDMRLRRYGASGNSFPSIVASGPNSAVPHHATGRRRLKAGEPVIMDFGGIFENGYCSDITRTAFVPGKSPTAKMREIYEVVLAANKAARKALRPGLFSREYDKVARDYIIACGYGPYFTHGLGHSLGLEAHDPYDYEHDPFQVGTVITDEPGIYVDGLGGVRIEDDLAILEDGVERLTNAPYWRFE
jgi:Xaa-Pro aminopeptidase